MYRHYCGAQRVSPYTVSLYTIVQVSLSSISNRIRSNSPLYNTKLPGKPHNKLKTGSQLLKNFSGGALPPQTPRAPLAFTLCVKASSRCADARSQTVDSVENLREIKGDMCYVENFGKFPILPTRQPANPRTRKITVGLLNCGLAEIFGFFST